MPSATNYTISQDETSLTVTFAVPAHTTKKDLQITFSGETLVARVKTCDTPIIAGTLFDVPESTLWSFEPATLRVSIEIEKPEPRPWPVLIKGPAADGQIDPVSQTLLGELFEAQGDLSKAQQYFKEAADRGSVQARVKMRNLFLLGQKSGYPVERDLEAALQYWHAAAEENNELSAQLQLAAVYLNGSWDVPVSPEKAVELYQLAIDAHNSSEAYHNLGVLYSRGVGVARDTATAFRYWKKAADAGFAQAAFNVAVSYLHGSGVAKSTAEAKKYFEKAKALDPTLAIPAALDELLKQEEKEEIVTAQAAKPQVLSRSSVLAKSDGKANTDTARNKSKAKVASPQAADANTDVGGEEQQQQQRESGWFWKAAGVVAVVGLVTSLILQQLQK